MSKRANPTVIGGFVVGAVVLIVAGVLTFGSGILFTATVPAIMYFEGDIKGLRTGASVDFQGVQVGTVTDIKAVLNYDDFTVRIPVIVDLTPTRIGAEGEPPDSGTVIQTLVEQGLRAQLQLESLVTGQLFIQLTLHPDVPTKQVVVDPRTQLPQIPTVPTTFQEVQQTVGKALEKLGELPLEQMVADLQTTLQGISQLVNAPEVLAAVRTLDATLTDVQQLVQTVEERVGPTVSSVTETMENVSKLVQNADRQVTSLTASLKETSVAAHGALEQLQTTLTTLEGVTTPGSPLQYELMQALRELSRAGRALRVLADYLERHPSAVLFGRDETGGQ